MPTYKSQLAERARQLISRNALIIDTETTGLGDDAEIVEIAICDALGTFEFNTLVKPSKPIPAEASAIHGINDDMVARVPGWAALGEIVYAILEGRDKLAYNADYDHRLVRQTAALAGIHHPQSLWGCLMKAYQDFRGYSRWPKLSQAVAEIGYAWEGNAHRAMADAKAARAVLFHMAAYEEAVQVVQPALIDAPAAAPAYAEGEV